ncbi:transport and Golgi organization protein 2-like [Diorhabda carinulata]|uniref:transport and Golgi organization protein 2-like n=1 Tax=Diorhabda carinulata TaxID=1163345 RepID=UPI0025A01083|nr:transport and Golgi organization protein 2-like [Diorhabda carinulata]
MVYCQTSTGLVFRFRGYRLILATNRDELYVRPALPAHLDTNTNIIGGDRTFFDYTDILDNTLFNGYNFVGVKDATVIYHHSNFPNISSRYTGKQIAGFGNSPINNPLKKVTEGTHHFKEIINRNIYGEELEKELLELMKDQTKHLPDTQLEMSNSIQ